MPATALYLWQGRVLVIARLPDLHFHSHQAAGICLGLGAPLELQASANGQWQQYDAVLIPPRQGHGLRFAPGASVACLFFDPGSVFYERIFELSGALDGPARWTGPDAERTAAAINRLWRNEAYGRAYGPESERADEPKGSARQVEDELRQIPCVLNTPGIDRLYGDPRIAQVVARIIGQADGAETPASPSIEELAELAGMSPSRLAHLFRAEVGLPVRALRTWFRLKTATIHIRRGASLTDAALAAGFYDQAHFTRTFRAMFGLPPSLVFPRDAEKVRWYIEAEDLTLRIAANTLFPPVRT